MIPIQSADGRLDVPCSASRIAWNSGRALIGRGRRHRGEERDRGQDPDAQRTARAGASTGGTSCVTVGAEADRLAGIDACRAVTVDGLADLVGHRFDREQRAVGVLPRIDQRAQRAGAFDLR